MNAPERARTSPSNVHAPIDGVTGQLAHLQAVVGAHRLDREHHLADIFDDDELRRALRRAGDRRAPVLVAGTVSKSAGQLSYALKVMTPRRVSRGAPNRKLRPNRLPSLLPDAVARYQDVNAAELATAAVEVLGMTLFNRGRRRECADLMLAMDPPTATGLLYAAQCAFQAGDYAAAVDAGLRSCQLAPTAPALAVLTWALFERGDRKSARLVLAVVSDPALPTPDLPPWNRIGLQMVASALARGLIDTAEELGDTLCVVQIVNSIMFGDLGDMAALFNGLNPAVLSSPHFRQAINSRCRADALNAHRAGNDGLALQFYDIVAPDGLDATAARTRAEAAANLRREDTVDLAHAAVQALLAVDVHSDQEDIPGTGINFAARMDASNWADLAEVFLAAGRDDRAEYCIRAVNRNDGGAKEAAMLVGARLVVDGAEMPRWLAHPEPAWDSSPGPVLA